MFVLDAMYDPMSLLQLFYVESNIYVLAPLCREEDFENGCSFCNRVVIVLFDIEVYIENCFSSLVLVS